MKIGLSTSVIGRGKTGIAQYLFGLVRALAAQAGDHRLFLFVLEEDLPLFDFVPKTVRLVPVSERFRPPVKNIFWHQWVLPGLLRELKIDVIHVPSYRRMLFSSPCARVATIHDLAPCQLAKKYEWKRMIYGKMAARQLARRQNEIIAVSHTTAADIMRFFKIPPERIQVIHNGIDHDRFFPAEVEKTAIPYFLYVARLEHPAKNHWRLIDAFNRFKADTKSNWQLVLAGSDWQAAEVIHQAVRQSPYVLDIRCLGFVADKDLPALYRAAGIFIYPSLYEGFGMPPIEAMACGCPVLASAAGALGEVLGNAAEIIPPENVAAIAVAMKDLVADSAKRERLRQAGLRRAQNFTWQKAAEETWRVYERALEQARPNSATSTLNKRKSCAPSCPANS
ncbi:MAG TPA: glycosyltransferase family 1 protein [Candidatus Saccharimonadales bacterium]|nr:glycosyltransferase family 1 protein [Candidatus Saccharimonadales bacterium]